MAKIATAVIFVALAVLAQGFPQRDNDIASAAAAGNWDEVHRLLNDFYSKKYGLTRLSASDDLRSFKPQPGGHFYGESEYTYHSATNNNGQTSEQSGGHKVVNNDGKVTEFDFQPPKPKY